MAVDVEVGHIAVHALTYVIGHPPNGQNVGRLKKCHPLLPAQPLAGNDLLRDGTQAQVIGLKGVGLGCRCHELYNFCNYR